MKKRVLLLSTLLTLTIVGCGSSKETNTPIDNSVEVSAPVETATPASIADLGTKLSVDRGASTGTSEVIDNTQSSAGTQVDINIGSDLKPVGDFAETYCTFTEFEAKTMFIIKDDNRYGNPNQFDGELPVMGSVTVEEETVMVNGTTEYNGVQYYITTNDLNEIKLIDASSLSETKPVVETPAVTPPASEATPEKIQEVTDAAAMQDYEIQAMAEGLGISYEQAKAMIGSGGGGIITPDDDRISDYEYKDGDTSGWSQEMKELWVNTGEQHIQ